MDKNEYVEATLDFLDIHGRLPYLPEDDVQQVVVDGDKKHIRKLRSSVRVRRYFKNWNKYLDYLFENNFINIKMLSSMIGDTEVRINNVINQSVKEPDFKLRRGLHFILGVDYYEKSLTPYHSKCIDCKKKCKQNYYVSMVACRQYAKK